jgi:hypothetical protein
MLNGEQAVSKTAVAGFDPRATCKARAEDRGLSHHLASLRQQLARAESWKDLLNGRQLVSKTRALVMSHGGSIPHPSSLNLEA